MVHIDTQQGSPPSSQASAENDAPKLPRAVTHARVGNLLYDLRETINDLIAIRVREFGELLDGEEGELLAIKSSLEFLLTDIRESRPKIRIVR